jgi:hypothetical protein
MIPQLTIQKTLSKHFSDITSISVGYGEDFRKCCLLPLDTAEDMEQFLTEIVFSPQFTPTQVDIGRIESGFKKADRYVDPNQAEDDYI